MTATATNIHPAMNGDKIDREMEIQMAAPILLSVLQPSLRPIVRALMECSDALQRQAVKLLTTILDPQMDDDDRFAAHAVLADVLFPNPAVDESIGMDLKECESHGSSHSNETRAAVNDMDEEEKTFAVRLASIMAERKMTQEELAAKIGVGQPAISMMLNRDCRPQRKTVVRLAEAIGVTPNDLWPGIRQ